MFEVASLCGHALGYYSSVPSHFLMGAQPGPIPPDPHDIAVHLELVDNGLKLT